MGTGTYTGATELGTHHSRDGIPGKRRRRLLLALGCGTVVLVAAGVVVLVTNPFSGGTDNSGVSDNAYPISYQAVVQEPLSSQTEVPGTLTYASGNNSATSLVIVLPSGAATSALTQARQQVSTAGQVLAADRTALASTLQANVESLHQADQQVSTAEATLAGDEQAFGTGGQSNTEAARQARTEVAAAEQTLNEDRAALSAANQSSSESLSEAQQQVATAESTLSIDRAALNNANQLNAEALAQAEQQVATARSTRATDRAALNSANQANAEALAQAEQQVVAAESTLATDKATLTTTQQSNAESLEQSEGQVSTSQSALSSERSTLATDQAMLSADEQKEAVDCRAGQTALSSPDTGPTPATTGSSVCATDASQVTTEQSTVSSDQQRVSADQAALTTAEQSVASTKTHNAQSAQQAQSQVTAGKASLTTAEQNVVSTSTHNAQSTQQAQSQITGAQAALITAEQNVVSTSTHNAQSTQQAQAKVASDEAAVGAAEEGTASTKTHNAQSTEQSEAKVTSDEAAVTAAEENVASTNTHDKQSAQQAQAEVNAAQLALSQDQTNLATDLSSASIEGETSTYTALPQLGQVVRRGDELFAIGGRPVYLLYGPRQPWRAFIPGMSAGPDVAELNANLFALGYGDPQGDDFSAATEAAVQKFQASHGLTPTGQLLLGSVLFEPAAFRVTDVTPTVGSTVAAGQSVLDGTLMGRQVQIALDTSEQSDVAVGDKVSIVMPDNSTTPGVVSYVGTVAQVPSNTNNGASGPTINVYVTPLDPAATGNLDQLPVNVWITTASVPRALVVPVDALLALASGGYALEVVGADRAHRLVGVTLGLFDDADGLVQVSGGGVYAGERAVVPGV